jgi:lysozyme
MATPTTSKIVRQQRSFWWVWMLLLLFCGACIGYWWWRKKAIDAAEFAVYKNFQIPIPTGYEIHGVDVSKYQGFIAWKKLQQMREKDIRLHFAFIKATEGLGKVDAQFERNWRESKKAGMIRGAYHFFLATKDGKAQAKHFLRTVSLAPGDLPPVLDIEQLYGVSPDKMRKEVKAWLITVEQATGVRPILYTYVNFYERYLGNDFNDYILWAAHYFQPEKPRIQREWHFWQHSEKGRVNGVIGPIDMNVFNGDSTDFAELLLQ